MKISKLTQIANENGVQLRTFGRGRRTVDDQVDIDKRNLFLLAIYEATKETESPVTHADMAGLIGSGLGTIQNALSKARTYRRYAEKIETFKKQLS